MRYRAHLEFDAPDDATAWLKSQRFARNAGSECSLVNVESEKRYFTDLSIPDEPGYDNVRLARSGRPDPSEIPF